MGERQLSLPTSTLESLIPNQADSFPSRLTRNIPDQHSGITDTPNGQGLILDINPARKAAS
jgi:hypothetical protein